MSDIDPHSSSELDLIDFSGSSSNTSSGELYVPNKEFDSDDSRENDLGQVDRTLEGINKSIGEVDLALVETKRLLRSRSNRGGDDRIEMSTAPYMTTKQALELIPVFNGENSDSNHAFINSCEYALENIDPIARDSFIKGITTRLTGKAYRAIRYKEVKTFQELKTVLGSLVDKKHTLSQLHSKLSMLRISNGETIQQYAERAEQLYYDILEVSSTTSGLANVEGIAKITSMQILTAFTEGLPHDTKIIVKACRPANLSGAVQIALEEETSRRAQKEIYQSVNGQKSKPRIQMNYSTKPPADRSGACFLCGRTNHRARDCRASEEDKRRFKSSRVKDSGEQRNIRVVTCRYCKKPNHTIEECRKRKFINERKEPDRRGNATSFTQGQASGNGQTPGTSGGRPVGQIKVATLDMGGLSISKPN